MIMKKVISKDGTQIAYDQVGQGPVVILVAGALSDRSSTSQLATLLAPHFTVINYDRRGRGDSGDTKPYATLGEIQDIEALIAAAGGSAYLWGLSSGAALALEAANQLSAKVKMLVLYEAPYFVDNSRPPVPAGYQEHLKELIAADRRGDAVKYFMRDGIGVPAIFVTMMRFMPAWSKLKELAPTLLYDVAFVVDYEHGKPLPANRWICVTMPTVVMCGGKSPQWMKNAMQALARVLPNAQHYTLEGQTHMVKAPALAPVLTEFFESRAS
jgi:pimeloyl-ACP methyl ester carboxylesterase